MGGNHPLANLCIKEKKMNRRFFMKILGALGLFGVSETKAVPTDMLYLKMRDTLKQNILSSFDGLTVIEDDGSSSLVPIFWVSDEAIEKNMDVINSFIPFVNIFNTTENCYCLTVEIKATRTYESDK